MSPGLILEKYRKNIESIDQITRIGSDVSKILLVLLKSLEKENEKIPGFILYKEKLERVIGEIEKIKNHPSLKDKYEVIYNQANVLLVSNLESSLTDLVITIVNEYHDIIQWPKEDKKIVFEVSVLNYKFSTLGEVITKSLGVEFNFQDLQSTLRFLKNI
ncbi:MAG: hypothetical protein WC839_01345 [Candidatus Paceibacterota bacterium]